MQANLTKLPELPENCFYFVDNPRAIAARSGIKAKVANARRMSRNERIANLAWFYASASAEGSELSPFDERD